MSSYRMGFQFLLAYALLSLVSLGQGTTETLSVSIDAARTEGEIKPLIDVNDGPICLRGYFDFSAQYKELGVRYIRLHDVPFTFGDVVDINYVFPDSEADPARAENYIFGQTDFYLKSIAADGYKMIYRLGYSAEFAKSPLVHNTPPKSFEKWSQICAQIVRHYNQGWADGMKLGIKYWEIWNEPDGPGFWSGTPEEFYRLYEITARAVKAADPSVKVGGPALALNMQFLEGMLKYCRDHRVPLDFVSWHIYAWSLKDVAERAKKVHSLMVKYGFDKAESILDEWNFVPKNFAQLDREGMFTAMGGMPGASFDAAVLIGLQDLPVDIAPFYTGTNLVYGLFNSYGTPQKAYYSFLSFRLLLACPQRLAVANPDQEDLPVLAGISPDKKLVRVLMSNPSAESRTIQLKLENLPWVGSASCEKQMITSTQNLQNAGMFEMATTGGTLTENLGAESVMLLTIKPVAAQK